jgi:acetyl esterase/lipase
MTTRLIPSVCVAGAAALMLTAQPLSAQRPSLFGARGGRLASSKVQPMARDVSYGADPAERLDAYAQRGLDHAPVLIMVHGGGWSRGDKAMDNIVTNKASRWVPMGIVFISINYPMLPAANPLQQAQYVARAIAYIRAHAAQWGGDSTQVVLMGHSAGAHLVALVASSPEMTTSVGADPWRGVVLLDSGALDVEAIMRAPHLPLYNQAFGRDPAAWRTMSPLDVLAGRGAPMLAVCSSQRRLSCPDARRFAQKGASLGRRIEVAPQDMTHEQINETLGTPGAYTDRVEQFLRSLDDTWARVLAR